MPPPPSPLSDASPCLLRAGAHPLALTPQVLQPSLSFDSSAEKRVKRKRVSWAPPAQLVEERTYTVADKESDRTPKSYRDDIEAEARLHLEQRANPHTQQQTPGALTPFAHAPHALTPPPPRAMLEPRRQWATPTLLEERYWPEIKGDMSTENWGMRAEEGEREKGDI